jgi:hypothetical protein
MPFDAQIMYDGMAVKNVRPVYNAGWTAEALMRINIARIFIQSSVAWKYTATGARFNSTATELRVPDERAVPQEQLLSMQFVSLETPVVVGFYILKNNPYSLSVMSGVNVKYDYDALFSLNNAGISNLRRDSPRYDLSIYSALEVMIGKLIFGFAYDYGLNRSSYEMDMNMQGLRRPVSIHVGQHVKYLSMSVGALF